MFKESFIRPEGDLKLKILALPLSLTTHVLILIFLITLPLFKTGRLPIVGPPDIIRVLNIHMDVPPPPPPPAGDGSGGQRPKTKIKPVQASPDNHSGALFAPVDIPDEIADESLPGSGFGWGVPDGVPWGIPDGVPTDTMSRMLGNSLTEIIGRPEEPVRPAGEVKAPKLIKRVDPIYPEIARLGRIQGAVIIEATTDVYGRVQKLIVLRSIPLLDQAAVDAVRQWIYEPLVVNGRPRAVVFTVTVRFTLQ